MNGSANNRIRALASPGMLLVAGVLTALTILFALPHLPAAAQDASSTPTVTVTAIRRGVGAQLRTPTPDATATVNGTATVTLTPTPSSTPTPAATPTLRVRFALAILPAPSVKHNLVGDVVGAEDVPISISYPVLFEDLLDFQMENVRDVTVGEEPGAGIDFVRFLIIDQQGNVVHAQDAGTDPPFCAFPPSGNYADGCQPFDLAANGNRWPNRAVAHGGRYTLVAFAQGVEPDHKGTWTLPFELRLSSEELGDTDGAVRIRSVERTGNTLEVEVETFGFTPFLFGTHLHFYSPAIEEEEAVGGVDGVIGYPQRYDLPGAYGSGAVVIALDDLSIGAPYTADPDTLCVAIAHPDESVLVGRGECVPIPD